MNKAPHLKKVYLDILDEISDDELTTLFERMKDNMQDEKIEENIERNNE